MLATWFEGVFPLEDPILVFAIVLVLMLGAPVAMGRFKLPGMVGLLLAGAILGPNILGVLARDKAFVLFGAVGLIYIMFTAAMEIDLAIFKRNKSEGIGFGVLTFAIPQGLGALVGHYVLGFGWAAAVLFGSLFASHTLLAYPMVSKMRLTRNRAVIASIGGTMLTDTAALLVLAVIAGMSRGEVNEAFWWRLGVSLSIYVAAILVGLPRLGRWFFRRFKEDGVAQFVFVLTSVFLTASLSHAAGVEPIVGAFLAGLAFNRLVPHNGPLMNRIQFTGDAIFVPFFLLSVGMLLDPRVLFGGFRTIAVSVCMLGTVVLAKWLAAQGSRAMFRYSREEAGVMFGLSVAQAAATLAAVMVGFEIGLFDATVINGAIVMILGTCIIGPWMVQKHGTVLAESEAGKDEEGGPTQRLLVPITNLEGSRSVIEFAMLMHDRQQAQPVFPLGVVLEGGEVDAEVAKNERTLKSVAAHLSSAEVPIHPMTRVSARIAPAILKACREQRISDVVASWDGVPSTPGCRFGKVLDEVLLDPERTLLVSRLPKPLQTTERVLLAVAPSAIGGTGFPTGITRAKQLAKSLGANLEVLAVKSDLENVKRAVNAAKPTVSTHFSTLVSWNALSQALTDRVQELDLIALLQSREVDPFGEQRFLPHEIASQFEDSNLVVIVPAEPAAASSPPVEATPPQPETAGVPPQAATG